MAEAEAKTADKKAADKKEKPPKEGKQKAPKEDKGEKAAKAEKGADAPKGPTQQKGPEPRLRVKYRTEITQALMKRFSYKNLMQVPKLEKIVVNMGLGEAVANPKIIDMAVQELGVITGQKPVVTRAKKSIANFKLREGLPIGAKVTLRREKMWEFLDRLVALSLPRVRDFRGTSPRAFDGSGNYTLGLREQIMFPEINFDKVDKPRGMNITLCTTAKTDDEAKALLELLGMPFRT